MEETISNKDFADKIYLIAQNIAANRKRLKMSQSKLAIESGLTITTISSIERMDLNNITLKTLVKIATVFNIPVTDLFK